MWQRIIILKWKATKWVANKSVSKNFLVEYVSPAKIVQNHAFVLLVKVNHKQFEHRLLQI